MSLRQAIGFYASQGVGYEAETTALLARAATQPSDALKLLINTTIKGLKDDGVFALGDCLYVRGVHEAQLACQNWIKNAHNSTLINSPIFTPKIGFRSTGTQYIDNNYIPYSQAINFGNTDATFIHIFSELVNGTNCFGAYDNIKRLHHIYYSSQSDRSYFNSGAYSSEVVFDINKMIGYTRSGNYQQGYLEGEKTGNNVLKPVVGDLINLSIFELAYNNNGAPAGRSGGVKFSYYGKGLNENQHKSIYNRIKYFYDNVGSTF